MENVQAVVYITLLVSLFLYARFVLLVINDITEHLGIACFTVRKKDKHGKWKMAKAIDNNKTSN